MTTTVTAVIPTHNRPELMRAAVRSVLGQVGSVSPQVIVVFDRAEPEPGLVEEFDGRIRVLSNNRTPGLAGARNTGILACDTDLVAFLDDDDRWEPHKLERQLSTWETAGRPDLVTTSITVAYESHRSPRLAGMTSVKFEHLLRSRMSMLHSSTFLFRRDSLITMGMVDETIPGSQNEDWDILLKSARRGPICHVDEPLVVVAWGRASYFSRRWDSRNDSLAWMLDRHPEIMTDAVGASRVYGQLAFGEAAQGNRGRAIALARRALRVHPKQWRAWVSLPVAAYPKSSEWVMSALHRFGRGV